MRVSLPNLLPSSTKLTGIYRGVIEDNKDIRENTCELLELAGYTVYAACNGKDGLACVKKNKPDLVIIDLMISEVDGFDICKQICDLNIAPVIAFNMRGGDADLLKSFKMGVDDYIGKPFGVDELMARMYAGRRHKRFTGKALSENNIEWSKIQ